MSRRHVALAALVEALGIDRHDRRSERVDLPELPFDSGPIGISCGERGRVRETSLFDRDRKPSDLSEAACGDGSRVAARPAREGAAGWRFDKTVSEAVNSDESVDFGRG